ncbi:MAG TPA: response regulator transcription factor [Candidatus Obscuribacterales bacterium]
MAKILLVEDDSDLTLALEEHLKLERHTVEVFHDGRDGEEALKSTLYDVVILDWDLPGVDGITVLQRYRERGGQTPVIMLTGKGEIAEKTQGLDSGADDYLTKPFDSRELMSRIRSLLRRPPQMASSVLTYGDLTLDPASFRITRNGVDLRLLPRDFALLEFLMRHPGEVFSIEALQSRVWHYDSDSSPAGVRMAISRIRKVIDKSENESMIENVARIGYRLRNPD